MNRDTISPNFQWNRQRAANPWNDQLLCVILCHVHYLNRGGMGALNATLTKLYEMYCQLVNITSDTPSRAQLLVRKYRALAVVDPQTNKFIGILPSRPFDAVYPAEGREKRDDITLYDPAQDDSRMVKIMVVVTRAHQQLLTNPEWFAETYIFQGVRSDKPRLVYEFGIGFLCLYGASLECTALFRRLGKTQEEAVALYSKFRARCVIGRMGANHYIMCHSQILKRIIPVPVPLITSRQFTGAKLIAAVEKALRKEEMTGNAPAPPKAPSAAPPKRPAEPTYAERVKRRLLDGDIDSEMAMLLLETRAKEKKTP